MQGFKKCSNGHFYKETLSSCPYCPDHKGGQSSDTDKTRVSGGTDSTVKTEGFKTENIGGASGGGDRTQVFTGGSAAGAAQKGTPQTQDAFERTFIGGVSTEKGSDKDSGNASADTAPRLARKIVGWIISYTLDPMGVDYRIYEGNNTIGRDSVNSIILAKDSTISGKHLTILYRGGKFWAKDEMSANGSFLNAEEMEIQKAYPLSDGDQLKLGSTVFKFKTAE